MAKSIIIIGAGIAGLAAGCYSRMNGYDSHIYEMHDKPGGVCTAWKRRGYTIDGCIHWLIGSNPESHLYPLWEELGAVQGRKFIQYEEFGHVVGNDGKTFTVYTDIDRFEKHMKELAPEDSETIDEFIQGIKDCIGFSWDWQKAPELYTPLDGIKMAFQMMPFGKVLKKWQKVTTMEFANRFKNEFLRESFKAAFVGDIENFSVFAMLMMMAWFQVKDAGYPLGGSLEFSRAIEKRYLDLGGKIDYKSPVERILVENDTAVGVRLADGTEHRADIIISCADGHKTIFDMLGGAYIDNKIKDYYQNWKLFPPLVYVGLGIARPFTAVPHHITFLLDKPLDTGNVKLDKIAFTIYNFDPSLAPEGKTVMVAMLGGDYDYWLKLYNEDMDKYKAEKERILDQVIKILNDYFPGVAVDVEVRDLATPITWERYSGNWRGSYEGWLMTTDRFMAQMSKELPGLKNFYMAGQWVEPGGGVPGVATSGRNVVQIICKRDGKKFVTTKP
jgi:phytoene dehydrogenase-like protein